MTAMQLNNRHVTSVLPHAPAKMEQKNGKMFFCEKIRRDGALHTHANQPTWAVCQKRHSLRK
eukprot:1568133-Amphidinium_carterae.1